jgi:hypothetical protein
VYIFIYERYGNVLQICKYTDQFGRLYGKAAVVMDRKDDIGEHLVAELTKMLSRE